MINRAVGIYLGNVSNTFWTVLPVVGQCWRKAKQNASNWAATKLAAKVKEYDTILRNFCLSENRQNNNPRHDKDKPVTQNNGLYILQKTKLAAFQLLLKLNLLLVWLTNRPYYQTFLSYFKKSPAKFSDTERKPIVLNTEEIFNINGTTVKRTNLAYVLWKSPIYISNGNSQMDSE